MIIYEWIQIWMNGKQSFELKMSVVIQCWILSQLPKFNFWTFSLSLRREIAFWFWKWIDGELESNGRIDFIIIIIRYEKSRANNNNERPYVPIEACVCA